LGFSGAFYFQPQNGVKKVKRYKPQMAQISQRGEPRVLTGTVARFVLNKNEVG
jgi:hypothetical protein